MSISSLTVSAPSRLHFGLLAFGGGQPRQYGGAGVMLRQPGLVLRLTAAERFETAGPLAERTGVFAQRFAAARLDGQLPACRLEVLSAPPEHVGLGVGTQLGLAVAAGLADWAGLGKLSPAALAQSVGRGRRSAVGVYGFCLGGMIVEAGHGPREVLSPLVARIEMPSSWRFVLARQTGASGLSGPTEEQAFAELPPVPADVTARLCQELLLGLMPAARAGDFAAFSASLHRYGHEAGMCFAARQAGAYASGKVAALAERIRRLGVEGVGQSSWGPTLYAVLPDERAAECLATELSAGDESLELTIAQPATSGGLVEVQRTDARAGKPGRAPVN